MKKIISIVLTAIFCFSTITLITVLAKEESIDLKRVEMKDVDLLADWVKDPAIFMTVNNLMAVDYQNNFEESTIMTRGEIIKTIIKQKHYSQTQTGQTSTDKTGTGLLLVESPFEDIDSSHYLFPYVLEAYEDGVASGYSEDDKLYFRPNKNVTRAEFVKMFLTANNISVTIEDNSDFFDVGVVDWYFDYVNTAKKIGLINGFQYIGPDQDAITIFSPLGTITKGQVAKIIYLYLQKTEQINSTIDFEDYIEKEEIEDVILINETNKNIEDISQMYSLLTLNVINTVRFENGELPPLILNEKLSQKAHEQALFLAENQDNLQEKIDSLEDPLLSELKTETIECGTAKYLPIDRDGEENNICHKIGLSTTFDRIDSLGIGAISASENIGYGTANTRSVIETIVSIHLDKDLGMMAGTIEDVNHKTNILSTFNNFTEIGIDVYIHQGKRGKEVYIVETFLEK